MMMVRCCRLYQQQPVHRRSKCWFSQSRFISNKVMISCCMDMSMADIWKDRGVRVRGVRRSLLAPSNPQDRTGRGRGTHGQPAAALLLLLPGQLSLPGHQRADAGGVRLYGRQRRLQPHCGSGAVQHRARTKVGLLDRVRFQFCSPRSR